MSAQVQTTRKYKCPDCDWSFGRPAHLARHALTHTGAKPHACTQYGCTSRYAQPHALKEHLKKSHGIIPPPRYPPPPPAPTLVPPPPGQVYHLDFLSLPPVVQQRILGYAITANPGELKQRLTPIDYDHLPHNYGKTSIRRPTLWLQTNTTRFRNAFGTQLTADFMIEAYCELNQITATLRNSTKTRYGAEVYSGNCEDHPRLQQYIKHLKIQTVGIWQPDDQAPFIHKVRLIVQACPRLKHLVVNFRDVKPAFLPFVRGSITNILKEIAKEREQRLHVKYPITATGVSDEDRAKARKGNL